jgi:hypothetical protein
MIKHTSTVSEVTIEGIHKLSPLSNTVFVNSNINYNALCIIFCTGT